MQPDKLSPQEIAQLRTLLSRQAEQEQIQIRAMHAIAKHHTRRIKEAALDFVIVILAALLCSASLLGWISPSPEPGTPPTESPQPEAVPLPRQ
jgi:hypothetical protein